MQMIPILSIVGKSDVGKTTLIEKLVKEMTARGHRVATIKHDAHSFEIDKEGKDSWRHKRAGAAVTVISSSSKLALVQDTEHDMTIEEIRDHYIRNVDIVITEGYKRENHPKIEVYRPEAYRELLCQTDENLVAIAGNYADPPRGVPVFALDCPVPLCDFIEKSFLNVK
jgi:molybdopterin-guanine dinucleotide biosynthesis adapter protein